MGHRLQTICNVTISIHVPREGHDVHRLNLHLIDVISIHVPREGHDCKSKRLIRRHLDFNPRAPRGARLIILNIQPSRVAISIHVPREGHDCILYKNARYLVGFQSTCPARGTTRSAIRLVQNTNNFNPRAPRGARLVALGIMLLCRKFQSTCPARGTTSPPMPGRRDISEFQSTCPARGTT